MYKGNVVSQYMYLLVFLFIFFILYVVIVFSSSPSVSQILPPLSPPNFESWTMEFSEVVGH